MANPPISEELMRATQAAVRQAGGNVSHAAADLGVSRSTLQSRLREAQRRLGPIDEHDSEVVRAQAQKGDAPEFDLTHDVPDGFVVKGVSSLYGPDDELREQWVKSRLAGRDEAETHQLPDPKRITKMSRLFDQQGKVLQHWVSEKADEAHREQLWRDCAAEMAAALPRLAPVEAPAVTLEKLCNLYTLTDCHIGMLAWGKETGADWDLTIAERTLIACFEHMMASSPQAKTAIINQCGDFLHFDGLLAITPAHGHVLDADSRFSKMVGVAIRVLRRVIDLALERHEIVHLVLAEGNHDPASAVWLRHMFKALYENEPRLTVNDNELPYYVHQHGKVMLGFHHGHLAKNEKMPNIFAALYPVIWGATTKRYVHTGHRHHLEEKGYPGVRVTQHATLAARDAYAARGGWISERETTVITYHSETGLAGTSCVTPEMVGA